MVQNKQNFKKGFTPYFLLLFVGILLLSYFSTGNNVNKEISYNEFNSALKENKVKEITITPSTSAYTYEITGKLKGAKKGESLRFDDNSGEIWHRDCQQITFSWHKGKIYWHSIK